MEIAKFSNIISENINDEFAYGKLDKFKIIIHKKTGYINATDLCKSVVRETGEKKKFHSWLENKSSKEIIEEIKKKIIDDPIIIIKNGKNELRGTYVHNALLMHVLFWICPIYALAVSEITNEYYAKKIYEEKIKLQNVITEKQSKIDILIESNKEIHKDLKETKEYTKKISNQNEELGEKIDKLRKGYVIERNSNPCFVLINNRTNNKYNYHTIRIDNKAKNYAIKKYFNKYPRSKIVLDINYNPNSINLLQRIKSELTEMVEFKRNDLCLINGYTEKNLIREIKKIDKKRYEI